MITCMKCGGFISHDWSNLSSICSGCAGKLTDELSADDLIAMAKVGLDALIDEATRYQEVRFPKELKNRYEEYKKRKYGT